MERSVGIFVPVRREVSPGKTVPRLLGGRKSGPADGREAADDVR